MEVCFHADGSGLSYGFILPTYSGSMWLLPAHRYSKVAKLDITGDSFSGKDLDSGIWVRDVVRDGDGKPTSIRFVNVSSLRPNEAAYDWKIYVFTQPRRRHDFYRDSQRRELFRKRRLGFDGCKEEKLPIIPKKQSREVTDEKVGSYSYT